MPPTGQVIGAAVAFVWLGMLLAITFLQAPLKFPAPAITDPLGGRHRPARFRAPERTPWRQCFSRRSRLPGRRSPAGDPVCWLEKVCPNLRLLSDTDAPTCPRGGEVMPNQPTPHATRE